MVATNHKVASVTKYLFHNPMGNWNAGTWNVLPAVLTTWANLIGAKTPDSEYALYREQAKNYKETARMNAELIKSKGEIALRNLVYRDKLEKGADVSRLGATGGNLSGTNLDVLVQKEKVRKMDEQTLKADFAHQAMMELYNGYGRAADVYGTMAAKATGDKYNVLGALFKGLEVYTQLSMRDADKENRIIEGRRKEQYRRTNIDVVYRDDITRINADSNKVEEIKPYNHQDDYDIIF